MTQFRQFIHLHIYTHSNWNIKNTIGKMEKFNMSIKSFAEKVKTKREEEIQYYGNTNDHDSSNDSENDNNDGEKDRINVNKDAGMSLTKILH